MSRGGIRWRPQAWYAAPAARILFQRQLAATTLSVRPVRPPRHHRGGFALAVELRVDHLPEQTITIVFSPLAPLAPSVYTTGPADSPHRYRDGTLCMWHPDDDPSSLRWTQRDGGTSLLGHVIAHLLREQWWRRTGEWPGEEYPHLQAGMAAPDEWLNAA